MDIRNCKRCGVVFQYENTPVCSKCLQMDEDDFKRVKDYLWENPKSSLVEVSNILEISTEKIKRFLRDGRLETVGEHSLALACEKCGTNISSGRHCNSCQNAVKSGLKAAVSDMGARGDNPDLPDKNEKNDNNEKKPTGGFYFKSKDKK